MDKFLSDIEIANNATPVHIQSIAEKLGLSDSDLEYYGKHKAKIKMKAIRNILEKENEGKLILVSAITPTPAGEGKTTTSIGLTQALCQLGKNATVALREPSLGPCLGKKGGAAGGGYSQVLPMEDINLHFTGDMHAISAAHNLIAAALDNHLHHKNKAGINIRNLSWRRVMDMNDRSLRDVVIGLGGTKNSLPRETGFDITAASEIMAALCLSLSYSELKEKIGNILLGFNEKRQPFYVKDLGVHGAAAALLKDALLPNLVQTIENTPAFIHGGPFANIAQGTNSIMATKLALKLSDYVVTEAGFGFDLGAEKFFDIVCQYGKFCTSAVVLVATVRALKMHGGVPFKQLHIPNPEAVRKGSANLEKHIENIRKFGMYSVVAINRFTTDTEEELEAVAEICRKHDMEYAHVDYWGHGGKGGLELAEKVVRLSESNRCVYKCLYDWDWKVEDKIMHVAKEIYGAEAVDYTHKAKDDLKKIYKLGYDKLPICIAKTQQSLSDNPKLLGRPKDFLVTVREIVISSGAGFLVPITGDMMRMPGLPKTPAAESIDIDDNGNISGLF